MNQNKRRHAAALWGLLVTTFATAVHAQVATYEFTGTVRTSEVPDGILGGFLSPVSPYPELSAQVGDPVTGKFSFDQVPGQNLGGGTDGGVYADGKAAIEINVNGHRITASTYFVLVSRDDPEYGGSDVFGIFSGDLRDNGNPVSPPGSDRLNCLIQLADQTQTALTSADLPRSLDLGDFNLPFGMIRHTGNAGAVKEGIEFSIDSLNRVYELRTARFVVWPDDSPLSLEMAEQVDGPYQPYNGEVGAIPGEQFVEMDATGPRRFYRLAEPPPVGLGPEDFDALPVGMAPDVGTPVGGWQFYADPSNTETDPAQISIVPTSAFDPEGSGNSLQVSISSIDPTVGIALFKMLSKPLHQTDIERVLARFDIFVPEGAAAGCAIYVGGDHGGGGAIPTKDRGPQIVFMHGAELIAWQFGGKRSFSYTRGSWQAVELDINLRTDTYALSIGPRGGPLVELANGLRFRSGPQEFIDRFTVAVFGNVANQWRAYVDNVSVKPAP